jgi:hypothetical protein
MARQGRVMLRSSDHHAADASRAARPLSLLAQVQASPKHRSTGSPHRCGASRCTRTPGFTSRSCRCRLSTRRNFLGAVQTAQPPAAGTTDLSARSRSARRRFRRRSPAQEAILGRRQHGGHHHGQQDRPGLARPLSCPHRMSQHAHLLTAAVGTAALGGAAAVKLVRHRRKTRCPGHSR